MLRLVTVCTAVVVPLYRTALRGTARSKRNLRSSREDEPKSSWGALVTFSWVVGASECEERRRR